MINCAIIGATGYTGAELIKILIRHPQVRLKGLTSRQKEPIPVRSIVSSVPKDSDLQIRPFSFSEIKRVADVVFLCLPHTEAAETVKKFRDADKVVIDLSADFRLRDPKAYEKWYGVKHKHKELLEESVYGLPEMYRDRIQRSDLIANPGCYPTGAVLGTGPLLEKKMVDPASIVIDAKSGVSGAGKKLTAAMQFCEVDENFYAYKIGGHPHTPEIEQTLSEAAGKPVTVTFVPHLLPVDRGILSTIYLSRRRNVRPETIRKVFEEAYGEEPFVRLKGEGEFPTLHDVRGTNYCDIGVWLDPESDRIIVITAIDNLVKGASGQAVQNMNIRCGFDEEEGLRLS